MAGPRVQDSVIVGADPARLKVAIWAHTASKRTPQADLILPKPPIFKTVTDRAAAAGCRPAQLSMQLGLKLPGSNDGISSRTTGNCHGGSGLQIGRAHV